MPWVADLAGLRQAVPGTGLGCERGFEESDRIGIQRFDSRPRLLPEADLFCERLRLAVRGEVDSPALAEPVVDAGLFAELLTQRRPQRVSRARQLRQRMVRIARISRRQNSRAGPRG